MNSPLAKQRIVFCDFDGTITAQETFVGMLKAVTPELSAQLMPLMYDRSLTLRAGVRQLLESIPSHRYHEIIEFALEQSIRPGLKELLDFLDEQSIPFVVISGGVYAMVEAVLAREGLLGRVKAIAAVNLNYQGEFLKVVSQYEGETELIAKVEVMNQYPAQETIAIGDSVTDINMALQADLVFARDRLQAYLYTEGKSYLPWSDFFEIRDRLQAIIVD
jgi:2-hydroxy-3-keto-5-methylthiopentenyl-1-phosphate phosphatase